MSVNEKAGFPAQQLPMATGQPLATAAQIGEQYRQARTLMHFIFRFVRLG